MSQPLEEKVQEKCKFCNRTFLANELDAHIDRHIIDSNTPAAILIDNKYVCQFMNDYSSYTLYGKMAIFEKFIDIPCPSEELYNKNMAYIENGYEQFILSFESLKTSYYQSMSDNEVDFLKEKGLFEFQSNMLIIMDRIWQFMRNGSYTERRYQSLLQSIRDKI